MALQMPGTGRWYGTQFTTVTAVTDVSLPVDCTLRAKEQREIGFHYRLAG